MARFTQLVGRSPMAILRDLRMRDAAQQLKATNLSIDQIAHNMGYSSRSSFTRAFKKTYGSDPAGHQAGSKIE
jgi:AraC-like DNA-binding protein